MQYFFCALFLFCEIWKIIVPFIIQYRMDVQIFVHKNYEAEGNAYCVLWNFNKTIVYLIFHARFYFFFRIYDKFYYFVVSIDWIFAFIPFGSHTCVFSCQKLWKLLKIGVFCAFESNKGWLKNFVTLQVLNFGIKYGFSLEKPWEEVENRIICITNFLSSP